MKTRKEYAAAAALLLLAVTAACTREKGEERILGSAKDVTISTGEYRAFLQLEDIQGRETLNEETKAQLLKKVLVRKSLAAEAESRGLAEGQEAAQAIMIWKVRTFPEHFWKRLREGVTVSDEEIREHLQPLDRYLLSSIVLGADEEGREKAGEIHEALEKGGDFAALARERSLGLAADAGGDIGWQTIPSDFIEEPEGEKIRALRPGEYTEPLRTKIGWVIFQLREKVTADEDFSRRREEGRAAVFGQKYLKAKAELMKEMRESADIVYHGAQEGEGVPPLAVVDGQPIFPLTVEGMHGAIPVSTRKEQLDGFIDAYLVVRKMEEEGLDSYPELEELLGMARILSLADIVINHETKEGTAVSDEEIEEEYRRFYLPRIYRMQVVVGREEERVREAWRLLEEGADFDDVAAEYNSGQLQIKKGRLGWMPSADFPEGVREVLADLGEGEHSPVIEVEGGFYYIVKVEERKDIETPPLEEVTGEIRRKLRLKKRSEVVKDFMREFTSSLEMEIDEKALRAL